MAHGRSHIDQFKRSFIGLIRGLKQTNCPVYYRVTNGHFDRSFIRLLRPVGALGSGGSGGVNIGTYPYVPLHLHHYYYYLNNP
jgi:hypothetical protein